jgi:hypothetical protein
MLRLLVWAVLASCMWAWLQGRTFTRHAVGTKVRFPTCLASQRDSEMTVDEIKSELELRGVDYSECTSKTDLIMKLQKSRLEGKADATKIFERFNEVKDVEVTPEMFESEFAQDVVAADGTLPGGIPLDMMKALASDREVASFLRDPKMQEIMAAVMSGGEDALKRIVAKDPDAIRMLQKLTSAMGRVQSQTKPPIERPDEPGILQ